MRPPASTSMRGFTFVELLAVIVVLLIVGGIGFQAIQMTSNASASTVFLTELDQRAQRALARIVRELQESQRESYIPDPAGLSGVSTLNYRCAEVDSGTQIVIGEFRRIELTPSTTDALDGLDNDGDGFVDEHDAHIVYDVGLGTERRMLIVRNVAPLLEGETANLLDDNGNELADEAGLSLSLRAGILNVRLSVLGRDPDGNTVIRTVEATVWPRN